MIARCSIFSGKKSQVTLFIIIGIIILAGATVIFMLRGRVSEMPAEVAVAERVPDEFKPIKDFIESCLNKKLKEAFIIIGQHGGYLDMSDAEISGRSFTLNPDEPTSSDAAFMTPYESSHVSYWWYMKTDNKCMNCILTDENKPGLDYIKRQSDYYIYNHLEECIDGFRSFKSEGFSIDTLGEPSADTQITENDVVVTLTYPINVTIEDNTASMSRYFTKIQLDFKDFYELADKINRAEMNSSFLEYVAKQIIGVYGSGADTSRLPPIYAREESHVPKIWSRTIVDKSFRSLLVSYVPPLQSGNLDVNAVLFSSR